MVSADFKLIDIVYLLMIEVTETVWILLIIEFKYWDDIHLENNKVANDLLDVLQRTVSVEWQEESCIAEECPL